MSQREIAKHEVPGVFQPWFIRTAAAVSICFWAVLAVTEVGCRPGGLELVLGVLLGIPWGLAYSRHAVRHAQELTVTSRERPWLRVISCFVHMPTRSTPTKLVFETAALAFGVFGITLILDGLRAAAPNLALPWAKFTMDKPGALPVMSWLPTVFAYVYTIGLLSAHRVIEWYEGLPDQ